ncbi:hypothetical protein JCM16418A_03320 [Paenibacillus pini]
MREQLYIRMINDFSALHDYVSTIQSSISATAAAVYILKDGQCINEWYAGFHGNNENSRLVDAQSQFNVASVRKTYLGLVVSLAIYEGKIHSLDDLVTIYLDELDEDIVKGITIRHLLTHTHGLQSQNHRLFPPGTDWRYNNTGVHMLIAIIRKLYDQSFQKY